MFCYCSQVTSGYIDTVARVDAPSILIVALEPRSLGAYKTYPSVLPPDLMRIAHRNTGNRKDEIVRQDLFNLLPVSLTLLALPVALPVALEVLAAKHIKRTLLPTVSLVTPHLSALSEGSRDSPTLPGMLLQVWHIAYTRNLSFP